ncbi:MAG: LptF/LptG family permease [Saprospiraceae bacterium]|nr:LptF/LptG family permease [Saprospiraceae bacterium]
MKQIDRYILKRYLSTFLFTAMLFSMIAAAIDASEKLTKFIKNDLSLLEVVERYYINFFPYINGLLWPLYALISVIFFTSRLAYNSEIISMFNAGMSFRRLLRPYMIGATIMALGHMFGNHYFIPKANKARLDFEYQYIWTTNDKGQTNDLHLFLKPGEKIFINFYRKADSSMIDVRLERYEGQTLTSILKARSARWMSATRTWRLRSYEIRELDSLGGEHLITGMGEELDTMLNLEPADFVQYVDQKDMMTTPELSHYIDKLRSRGAGNTRKFEVERYRRTADPFTILILTIIGVAVASRKVRGGMGLHLAIGIGMGAIYIFLSRFSTTFAMNQSLSPLLGVWIPNIIFAGISYWLAKRAQE